jgi:hypothetical protein
MFKKFRRIHREKSLARKWPEPVARRVTGKFHVLKV